MSEEEIREVFLKHYDGQNLNRATLESYEDIANSIAESLLSRHQKTIGEESLKLFKQINLARTKIFIFKDFFNCGKKTIATNDEITDSTGVLLGTWLSCVNYFYVKYDDIKWHEFKKAYSKEEVETARETVKSLVVGLVTQTEDSGTSEISEKIIESMEAIFCEAQMAILGRKLFEEFMRSINESNRYLRKYQRSMKIKSGLTH
ncbi:MAG: hypothetical protein Q8Q06_04285 [bacterium]|nr:hypothetical protein [bacterium]